MASSACSSSPPRCAWWPPWLRGCAAASSCTTKRTPMVTSSSRPRTLTIRRRPPTLARPSWPRARRRTKTKQNGRGTEAETAWRAALVGERHRLHGRALVAVAVDREDLDLAAALLRVHDVDHDDRSAQPDSGDVARHELLV